MQFNGFLFVWKIHKCSLLNHFWQDKLTSNLDIHTCIYSPFSSLKFYDNHKEIHTDKEIQTCIYLLIQHPPSFDYSSAGHAVTSTCNVDIVDDKDLRSLI